MKYYCAKSKEITKKLENKYFLQIVFMFLVQI